MGRILDAIDCPEDLKRCSLEELTMLATELREVIIQTVAQTGGHLAPSLGTVELTLALHRVFHCPTDKIIWDVGHQAYAHKILTGRRDSFTTLRQKGGLTGFPCRTESPYDAFGTGHASTSVSAALGMASARDLRGEAFHVIAVIGDGALTGGEAYEALNQAGAMKKRLLVILNDNGMSIAPNVGAMSEYLSRLRVDARYRQAKEDIKGLLLRIPHIGDQVFRTAEHIRNGVRSALVPGEIFSSLGFRYLGPFDGHDLALLLQVFEEARYMTEPVLIHVKTRKGRGYAPAERAPEKFHGVGAFHIADGAPAKGKSKTITYTKAFSEALLQVAAQDPDVVAITAAMPDGTGLVPFRERYPTRFFDVGIAEPHAVTFAAGLAAEGMKPVVAIYSTFLQRAYDQILHDVCLQNLHVVFCLDRAGLVGADGATHHGIFDLSYLRPLPHMVCMCPKDEAELGAMLQTALAWKGPVAIRYPRGEGLGVARPAELEILPIGKAEILQTGTDIALLAVGSMVQAARETAEILRIQGISCTVVNMRFVKPLDTECLKLCATTTKMLVTMEENMLAGGFGSAVAEFFSDAGTCVPLLRFGLGDAFIGQGKPAELKADCGLLPTQMAQCIATRWEMLAKEGA